MKVKVNGNELSNENAQLTLSELLKEQQVKSLDMISVQLNGSFVAREKFDQTLLAEGDNIDFLYFMGGGSDTIPRIRKSRGDSFIYKWLNESFILQSPRDYQSLRFRPADLRQ